MSNELVKVDPISTLTIKDGCMMPVNFDQLWRLSEIVASSGMAPKTMARPEQLVVAAAMGMEVGLSYMQSIQGIAVINGRPSLWGDAMLGLIQSSGTVESWSETFSGVYPQDDFTAICTAKRKGGLEYRNEFSVAEAKEAGLWGKQGPWQQYKRRMLKMRARAFTLRDGWSDILRGLHMAEEMIGADSIEMRSVGGNYEPVQEDTPSLAERVKAAAPDRAPNGKADAVDPEPEQPGQEAPTQPDTTDPEPEPMPPIIGPETKLGDMLDSTQLKKLNAMIRERGLDRAGVKLAMRQFEVHPKGAAVFRPFDVASSKDIQLGNVQYFEQMLDELAPANLLKIRVDEYGKRVRDFEGFVKVAMRDGENPINITHWYLLQRHQIDRLMKKNENGKSLIDELAEEALAMQEGMA